MPILTLFEVSRVGEWVSKWASMWVGWGRGVNVIKHHSTLSVCGLSWTHRLPNQWCCCLTKLSSEPTSLTKLLLNPQTALPVLLQSYYASSEPTDCPTSDAAVSLSLVLNPPVSWCQFWTHRLPYLWCCSLTMPLLNPQTALPVMLQSH